MTGHVLTKSKREMECCMLDVAVIITNTMFLAGFKTNKTNQKKKVIVLSLKHFSPPTGHIRSLSHLGRANMFSGVYDCICI